MAERPLRGVLEVVVHGVDDSGMVPGLHPLDALLVGGAGLGGEYVDRVRSLVLRQLLERPEGVAHPAGRKDHRPAVESGDSLPDRLPHGEEVIGLTGLHHRDRDHVLVVAQVVEEVDGGVVHREVLIFGSVGRGPELLTEICGEAGQLRVSGEVVRDLRHAPGQLGGGEDPATARLGGEQVLHRREPVGVDDDDRVRVERVEHLAAETNQTGHQADLLSVVDLPTRLLVEHDGGGVAQEPGADDLAHWSSSGFVGYLMSLSGPGALCRRFRPWR